MVLANRQGNPLSTLITLNLNSAHAPTIVSYSCQTLSKAEGILPLCTSDIGEVTMLPTRAEKEFNDRMANFERDARAGAVFTYTQLTMHHLTDPELYECLNNHAAFWNGVMGALQTAAIVALGRIYDSKKGSYSAEVLLDFANQHRGIFSQPFLERRKIDRGLSAEEARKYATDAYVPKIGCLDSFVSELQQMKCTYKEQVQPIRHDVFAHAGRLSNDDRNDLFTMLFVRDLERLTVFPLRLYSALYQYYENGREPVLADVPTVIGAVVSELPSEFTSTWEHMHVAADTKDFMESLKRHSSNSS